MAVKVYLEMHGQGKKSLLSQNATLHNNRFEFENLIENQSWKINYKKHLKT